MTTDFQLFTRLEELLSTQGKGTATSASFLDHIGTPCASVAVLENGRIHWRSFGSKPCDEETLFQACSISKAITSLAVLKLAEEERLDLDVPVAGYLTEAQLALISTPETAHLVGLISIRHILTHTSGLSVHGVQGYPHDVPTVEQTLSGAAPANVLQVHLEDIPGRTFSYSGGAFTVLQLILVNVLSKPFADLMQEIVLEPLGMTRSYFGALRRPEENFAAPYLNSHTAASTPAHKFAELAAAGLWTTPSDLLRAVAAVQNALGASSTAKKPEFLTRKWAEALITPSKASPEFGLGWQVSKDMLSWGHGGSNDPGYRCQVLGFKNGNGICVMTNSAEGVDAFCKITWAIAYLNEWPAALEHIGYPTCAPLVDSTAKVDAGWKDWKGSWGDWDISGESHPHISWSKGPQIPLLVAARRAADEDETRSLEFVIEGTNIIVRLVTRKGKRVLEAGKNKELQEFASA